MVLYSAQICYFCNHGIKQIIEELLEQVVIYTNVKLIPTIRGIVQGTVQCWRHLIWWHIIVSTTTSVHNKASKTLSPAG